MYVKLAANGFAVFKLEKKVTMKYKVTRKQNNSKMCILCGVENEFGMNARFYELENGELACIFNTKDCQQSYPGRTHGGMIGAVLDEVIGRALEIFEPEAFGVTVELSTKYKKPLPTDGTFLCLARITRNTRKIFEGTGEIYLEDGTVAAEAYGKYMKMPIDDISTVQFNDDIWFLLEEDDPKEIDVPERK